MTVAQLKSSLDADELAHWMAYDQLDPIGGYRLDANFAQLVMCQVGDEDSKLSDFLLVDPDPISEEEAQRREREAIAESNRRSHEAMKAQIAKLLEKQSSKKALSIE